MRIRTWPAVTDIGEETWDTLTRDASPFLEYGFLSALEDSGCVGGDSGWYPLLLTAHADEASALAGDDPLGAAPAYVKTHSMGEFVYDWSWADAAARMRVEYYPKLVITSPFTPVAGPRLLTRSDLDAGVRDDVRRALLAGALQVARRSGCHGVHMLFCTDEERRLAEEVGFAHRLGSQLHWENAPYDSFADYLDRFKSKRRNQIRRERRRVREEGVEVACYAGDLVADEHLEPAFRFYAATVDRFSWGRRYLNEHFFELLWERMRPRLHVVLAERGGQTIAGALNLRKGERLYGRYWGADAEVSGLHFEVCSYASIEDCIRVGSRVFEAGAGAYGHKHARGFLPTATHSVHRHFHPRFHAAIADFCEREASHLRHETVGLREGVFVR